MNNENIYKSNMFGDDGIIIIGSQCWMSKNLSVESYNNGDLIIHAATKEEWLQAGSQNLGAWCYYNEDISNDIVCGKLYNWYAVNDPRGLAPTGWHIPSLLEWNILEEFLGGSLVAGGKLKSLGTTEHLDGLWNEPNTGATDEYDFHAQPTGWRSCHDCKFTYFGRYSSLWTSDEYDVKNAYFKYLHYNRTVIDTIKSNKLNGFAVRCIKNC